MVWMWWATIIVTTAMLAVLTGDHLLLPITCCFYPVGREVLFPISGTYAQPSWSHTINLAWRPLYPSAPCKPAAQLPRQVLPLQHLCQMLRLLSLLPLCLKPWVLGVATRGEGAGVQHLPRRLQTQSPPRWQVLLLNGLLWL